MSSVTHTYITSRMKFMERLCGVLLEKGEIYTIREYKYVKSDCLVPGVGNCTRQFIKIISEPLDLEPYTSKSGFPTALEWWAQIQSFIRRGDVEMYLYHVKVEDWDELVPKDKDKLTRTKLS